MSPLLMSVIAFGCVLGGTFLGIFLRNRLPEHHLSAATKDVVRLGTGLIGTIAGLVLGLLIASANSTYETQSTQVQQLTANIVLLDRTLAQYGPETDLARNLLRRGVASMADRIWRENGFDSGKVAPFEASAAYEAFEDARYFEIVQLQRNQCVHRESAAQWHFPPVGIESWRKTTIGTKPTSARSAPSRHLLGRSNRITIPQNTCLNVLV